MSSATTTRASLQLASGEVQLITDVPANSGRPDQGTGGNDRDRAGSAVGFITLNEKVKPLDERGRALRDVPMRSTGTRSPRSSISAAPPPAKSILPSSTFYYDANTDPISFDLDKAKELLAKSSVAATASS